MEEGVDGSSFFYSTASHVQRNVRGNKTRTHTRLLSSRDNSAKGLQQGAAAQKGKSVRNTELTGEERRKEGEK
jgi:hypothetical protein